MKIITIFIYLLVCPLLSYGQSFSIEGESNSHGHYSGSLSILAPNEKGISKAVRKIRYKEFQYKNFAVEELWEGEAKQIENTLQLEFTLKRWGYISAVDGWKKETTASAAVSMVQTINKDKALSWDAVEETDQINSSQDDIVIQGKDIREEMVPTNLPFVARFFVELLADSYYRDKFVKKFGSRPISKSGEQFIEYDATNFSFYYTKPKVLRVVDQILDPASLEEEKLRYSAYAYTLKEKADLYEAEVQNVDMDEFGLLSFPTIDKGGKVIIREPDLSTLLWTGQYIMAENYRYELTHDQGALDSIKRALRGIFLLVDISPDKAHFGRSVRRRRDSDLKGIPETDFVAGTGKYSDLVYNKRDNRDMIRGLLMGLVYGYEALPDSETELREGIKARIKQVADNSVVAKSELAMLIITMGSAAIITGDQKYIDQYKSGIDDWRHFIDDNAPIPRVYAGSSDWSGNNLGIVYDIMRTHIAKKLNSSDLPGSLKYSFKDWRQLRNYRDATQNFFMYDELPKDKAVISSLPDSVWCLLEFPSQKPANAISFDHSYEEDFGLAPIPSQPWKFFFNDRRSPSDGYESIRSYPLFKALALSTNWVWRNSPFSFRGEIAEGKVQPGADYLFAYWLARHSKAIEEKN